MPSIMQDIKSLHPLLIFFIFEPPYLALTHWGRVMHICVSRLTIIGSDNGLSSGRRQAIIWTNAGILLNGPLVTNFSEILIEIYTFSFKQMHFKISWKFRPSTITVEASKTTGSGYRSNSLRQSDARWQQRTGSTLVMACCLTAPSHHLNQFSFIISNVPWHSSFEGILIRKSEDINHNQ